MKPENKLILYKRIGLRPANGKDSDYRCFIRDYRYDRNLIARPVSLSSRFNQWLNHTSSHAKGNLIGIEIECITPYGTAKPLIPGIDCCYDGSVTGGANSNRDWQECRFFLRKGQWGRLYSLCDYLNSVGASVNQTCGLHVHLDCRDKSRAEATEVAIRLARALPLLKALVPKSRLDNAYCKTGYSFSDRYHMINGTALSEHGTIEVRLHGGSTNPDKIRRWIELLLFVSGTTAKITSLDALLASRANPELKIWVVQRYAQFNPIKGIALESNERSAA